MDKKYSSHINDGDNAYPRMNEGCYFYDITEIFKMKVEDQQGFF